MPPVIIFVSLSYLSGSIFLQSFALAVMALAAGVICVNFAPSVIQKTGKVDPREIVIDEFAGQSVTFLAFSVMAGENISTRQVWLAAAAGFVLFRFFDIVKPWPIRRLEKLPAGWGILCDDLLAGLYAGLCLLVFNRLLIPG